MKTTIDLFPADHAAIKRIATDSGFSMKHTAAAILAHVLPDFEAGRLAIGRAKVVPAPKKSLRKLKTGKAAR